ncbi:MAG: DUF1232 domain-containing protein [Dehalococcoidia bacterium]|nr:DUF1232 domain-containing protein [Dehalococcoidia bacterium]
MLPDAGAVWWWVLAIAAAMLLAIFVVGGLLIWRIPRLRRALKVLRGLGWRHAMRGAWGLTRDPRVPWAVRLLPVPLFMYLALPLDIIPDFIPVLGQLDDVLIVAAAAYLVLRLTPSEVLREHMGIDRDSL